jgi:hypothetical protein
MMNSLSYAGRERKGVGTVREHDGEGVVETMFTFHSRIGIFWKVGHFRSAICFVRFALE